MSGILGKFEGKKTYVLLLVYIVVVLVSGGQVGSVDGFNVENIDAGDLKEALLAAALGTAKAAFDRFVKKSE